MKTLANSRLFLACILFNIICCLILLSEGYTLLGLIVLTAGIVLCAFFTLRIWRNKEAVAKGGDNEDVCSYASYLKTSRNEWFDMNTSMLVNQSIIMIAFRIVLTLSLIVISISSLVFDHISYFPNDIIFDKLMFVTIIVFAVIYLIFGFRFCAFPAFVTYATIMTAYFLHLTYHNALKTGIYHNLLTYFLIAASFSFVFFGAYIYYKKNVYYNNIEKYERDEACYGVDLFLNLFSPITDYDIMLRYEVCFMPIQEYALDDYIRRVIKLAHENDVVFAGYEKPNDSDSYYFCFYLGKDTKPLFDIAFKLFTEKENVQICGSEKNKDAEWKKYAALYPSNSELCEIISRKHIENLFIGGATFDREYELSFFVNFSNKADPVEFEERIKYFGFNLIYASYCEGEGLSSEDCYYVGEYATKSFISVRRLEYLNSLLLREAQEFGAVYLGEWEVEYEHLN